MDAKKLSQSAQDADGQYGAVNSRSASRAWLAFLLACYVVTGTLQPTAIDYLRLHHAIGKKVLLMPTLCNVLGMTACGVLASRAQWREALEVLHRSGEAQRNVRLAVVVDLVSGMLLTGGLLYSGGAVFTVLYNSVPAWTALLARVVLGRRLSRGRVGGVAVVCIGLALNVFGTQQHSATTGGTPWSALGGSAAVLVGSLLHSAMFLITERAVQHGGGSDRPGGALPPTVWSCLLGSCEAIFMLCWVVLGSALVGFRCGRLPGHAAPRTRREPSRPRSASCVTPRCRNLS